jgi:hypothetical protein
MENFTIDFNVTMMEADHFARQTDDSFAQHDTATRVPMAGHVATLRRVECVSDTVHKIDAVFR